MGIFDVNCLQCRWDLRTSCFIISGIDIVSNSIWTFFLLYCNTLHKGSSDILNILMILGIFQTISSVILIIGIRKKKCLFIDLWIFNLFINLGIQAFQFSIDLIYHLLTGYRAVDLAVESINLIPTTIVALLVPFVWKFRKNMLFEHQQLQRDDLQEEEV